MSGETSELVRPSVPSPDSRRPLVPVELPAWGITLFVRRLPVGEAMALPDDRVAFTGAIIIKSTCYADGARVWPDTAAAEVLAYPGEDLRPLIEQALAVNGITGPTIEAAKGNSLGETVDGGSSIVSPANSI